MTYPSLLGRETLVPVFLLLVAKIVISETVREEKEPASPQQSPKQSLWWVGCILDMFATLAGTVGKQFIRHSHNTGRRVFLYLGLLGTAVIDPIFDVSAYSFAPQSIITPMAGMVVVWNVLLAPYTLHEELTRTRKMGTFLVCVGTIGVGAFGTHTEKEYNAWGYYELFTRPQAIAYFVCFGVWYIGCHLLIRMGTRKRWKQFTGAAIGAIGGTMAGNMYFTKACVELLTCTLANACSPNPFLTPFPYVAFLITLGICLNALYWLTIGLKEYEALYMITVFEGAMIISGAISGNIVMNEKEGVQPVGYCLAILIILAGLWVLLVGENSAANKRGFQLADDAEGVQMGVQVSAGDREAPGEATSLSEIKTRVN